jgi:hypothetical protein
MEALKRISGILNDVQRFTGRTPWNEIHVTEEVKLQARKKTCSLCSRNPIRIFSSIERNGIKSVKQLCKSINHFQSFIEASPVEVGCTTCIQNTKSDLQYIWEKLEELRRFVLHQGFKVVEGEV